MEILIKCSLENRLDSGIYSVLIFNSNNNLVYKGKTNSNGILNVNLSCQNVYKIIVISHWESLCKVILLNSNLCKTLYFNFHNPLKISPFKTFIITDKYYKNLPIRKGVIDLWQSNIQSQLQTEKVAKKL